MAGDVADIIIFWDKLAKIGPGYGYFPKVTKSSLIVKKNHLNDANTVFSGTRIMITTEGGKNF